MLRRLQRALTPADPLYRRESGGGRRSMLVVKSCGLAAALIIYLLWCIAAFSSRNSFTLACQGITVFSCIFALLALVLGVQSMRNEVMHGTAEALVLTPISRRKAVFSKLAGSSEFLIIFLLLLPLYWLAMPAMGGRHFAKCFAHGGIFRLAVAFDSYYGWHASSADWSLASNLAVSLGAFITDLSWFILLVSIGAWAGTATRKAVGTWVRVIVWTGIIAGAITLCEWLGVDWRGLQSAFRDLVRAENIREVLNAIVNYHFYGWYRTAATPMAWRVGWLLFFMTLRLLISYGMLHLTARRFDRIATD